MSKKIDAANALVKLRKLRQDTWSNTVTGLGTTRDKMYYNAFTAGQGLSDEEADIMYAEDDVAARICDTMPEYSLRKGLNVKISPSDEDKDKGDVEETTAVIKEMETAITDELTRLDAIPKIVESAVWGNVFGAGAILLGGVDGAMAEGLLEPLNDESIQEISHLNVIDKRYLTPVKWYSNPMEEKFGTPSTYLITPYVVPRATIEERVSEFGAMEVHETRLLMFGGVRTSIQRRQERDGWEDSLLQRIQTILSQFGVSFDTLAHIISDANQAVFKMNGLIEAIAGDEQGVIQARMQLLDMGRSSVRAVLLDSSEAFSEDFNRQNFTWTGIEKPFELMMQRLSVAARQPVSVFMGRSPAGMNATGEHEETNFKDSIEAYRQDKLLTQITRLVELIFKSKQGPTGGQEPENWRIEFPSLYSMTPKEQAEIYELNSKGDLNNVKATILLPEEIALARYGPDGYKQDITIDLTSRMIPGEDGEPDPDMPPEPDPDPDLEPGE
jgi:phage-related protein (TIGR01555 family)